VKIRGIEECVAAILCDRQSLVDRAAGVGVHVDCRSRIHAGRPAGD
jgi:hypothetical protein